MVSIWRNICWIFIWTLLAGVCMQDEVEALIHGQGHERMLRMPRHHLCRHDHVISRETFCWDRHPEPG
jgi:hypothetical protein